MINRNEWITVGLITSCHGINGQVKVKSLSDFEERFLKPGMRWLQKENEPPSTIELISGFKQPGKETFIVKLKGVNTRNQAEQLKKSKILVKTDKLPKLKKELYEACRTIVEHEDAFIDLAFEMGPMEGLTAKDVKDYIRFIANRRLVQLGLEAIYDVDKNPLGWLDTMLNAVEHMNFFEGRATEYSKASTQGTWVEAFS